MLSVKQGSIKHHLLNLWYDLSFDWIPVSQTVEYYEYLNPCDSTHTNYCYKMGLVTWSHTIDCKNKLDFYSELPHKVWHAVKPANRLTNQTVCIYVCTILCARACVCVCVCVCVNTRLKSSYDDIISAAGDFLSNEIQALQYQWMKCAESKGGLCWKINLIWSHSMRVSWAAYELFSQCCDKWSTPIDPHIWPSKSRTTSSNIHTAAMWGYGM